MNQDSSFPPMLPPSTELGALLFAVLPCLQETYRPLASFAYHMTELTRLKTIPSIPSLSGLSGIDALITDKDSMLRSLSFYGKMFRMPLLSTIATLLQGMQFYQAYKDILPGLFSGFGGSTASGMSGGGSSDLFSMLGGLSPDLLASLFSGFSGGSNTQREASDSAASPEEPVTSAFSAEPFASPDGTNSKDIPKEPNHFQNTNEDFRADSDAPSSDITPPEETDPSAEVTPTPSSDPLFDSLYSFLTPEQQKIYEQLMHTD